MHGREEWVLVQLRSQHKLVERPVLSMFPDYRSVPCDYDETPAQHFTKRICYDKSIAVVYENKLLR